MGNFLTSFIKKYVSASQSKTHLRCAAIAIITFPTSNNQIPKKVDFKNVLKNQDTKIFNTSSIYMDNMYKQHGDSTHCAKVQIYEQGKIGLQFFDMWC